MNLTEAAAWAKVNAPTPRLRYEHLETYNRRVASRQRFVSKIFRTPEGCWLWRGNYIVNPSGSLTPRFQWSEVKEKYGRNVCTTSESAFTWMAKQWFPDLFTKHAPTAPSCNKPLCISPVHRQKVPAGGRGNLKLTPTDVLNIYALKGKARAPEVAERYKINPGAVFNIWSGRSWSAVTGEKKRPRGRVGPSKLS